MKTNLRILTAILFYFAGTGGVYADSNRVTHQAFETQVAGPENTDQLCPGIIMDTDSNVLTKINRFYNGEGISPENIVRVEVRTQTEGTDYGLDPSTCSDPSTPDRFTCTVLGTVNFKSAINRHVDDPVVIPPNLIIDGIFKATGAELLAFSGQTGKLILTDNGLFALDRNPFQVLKETGHHPFFDFIFEGGGDIDPYCAALRGEL